MSPIRNNGYLQKKEDNSNAIVTYDYHPNGQLSSKTLARGTTNTYSYHYNDRSSRLSKIDYADPNTTDIEITSYDKSGRPRIVIDRAGKRTITYHISGDRDLETFTTVSGSDNILSGIQIDPAFDSKGRRNSVSLVNGSSTILSHSLGYSASSRISSLSSGIGSKWASISFGWQTGGPQLTSRTSTLDYYTVLAVTQSYDAFQRISGITATTPSPAGGVTTVVNDTYTTTARVDDRHAF